METLKQIKIWLLWMSAILSIASIACLVTGDTLGALCSTLMGCAYLLGYEICKELERVKLNN
jgi:hypothetical protein